VGTIFAATESEDIHKLPALFAHILKYLVSTDLRLKQRPRILLYSNGTNID